MLQRCLGQQILFSSVKKHVCLVQTPIFFQWKWKFVHPQHIFSENDLKHGVRSRYIQSEILFILWLAVQLDWKHSFYKILLILFNQKQKSMECLTVSAKHYLCCLISSSSKASKVLLYTNQQTISSSLRGSRYLTSGWTIFSLVSANIPLWW